MSLRREQSLTKQEDLGGPDHFASQASVSLLVKQAQEAFSSGLWAREYHGRALAGVLEPALGFPFPGVLRDFRKYRTVRRVSGSNRTATVEPGTMNCQLPWGLWKKERPARGGKWEPAFCPEAIPLPMQVVMTASC